MNRNDQRQSAVLPVASMASYPLGICGTCDRQTGSEGCREEERSGGEREEEKEEERNVTGGDNICQGNKRS